MSARDDADAAAMGFRSSEEVSHWQRRESTRASGHAAPIQRFNNLAGLMNPAANGLYVRYEDHIAALEAIDRAKEPSASSRIAGQEKKE